MRFDSEPTKKIFMILNLTHHFDKPTDLQTKRHLDSVSTCDGADVSVIIIKKFFSDLMFKRG